MSARHVSYESLISWSRPQRLPARAVAARRFSAADRARSTRSALSPAQRQPGEPVVLGPDIEVVGADYEITPALEDHALLRTGIAIDRVDNYVRRIRVRLSDANGPRGGEDQLCRIECWLEWGSPIFVEARETDAYVAVDVATTRLKSAVTREVKRRAARARA